MFTNDFSKEVWQTTFKHFTENKVEHSFRRVAKALASAETTDALKTEWEDKFFDLLSDFKFTAGGRIYSNAGTGWKGTTWHNCFVGPQPEYDMDSLEGIFQVLLNQAQTLKSEGGWGYNFSFIRPRGSFIHGVGVETPGAVKYMELFDKSSELITAGSDRKIDKKESKTKIRKGAMMAILDCWHPDLEEFITAKQKEGRLTKFNISVGCYNDLMDKICEIDRLKKTGEKVPEELERWDLVFPDTKFEKYKAEWDGDIYEWKAKGYPVKIYKTVKVTDVWESIMSSTYNRNDPGVFFVDRANATHCWSYGKKSKIRATNPCGEQSMPFGSNCDLGSMNVSYFFKDGKFDFTLFKKYVRYAVRFLDNANEVSPAPIKAYEESMRFRRRIGLGIIGWGSLLYLMKIRFASKEADTLREKILGVMTRTAVDESINLAVEKGAFRDCDKEKHASHAYWKKIGISDAVIEKIRKYGIRNSSLFSCQPNGNTSVFANNISSGIEPIFAHEIIRTMTLNSPPDEIKELVPKYWEGDFNANEYFTEHKEGKDTILKYVHTDGIVYKIDKNRGLSKEVVCEDFAVKVLKEKGEWDAKADWAVVSHDLSVDDHVSDMTGFAKFMDASISKTVNVRNDYPYESFKKMYMNAYLGGHIKGITSYREGTTMTVLSTKKNERRGANNAAKRPKQLSCDIYTPTVKGEPFFVLIGKLDESPYEVFAGKLDFSLPKSNKSGIISKETRGKYVLTDEEGGVLCENVAAHLTDHDEAITRLISTSLRHECPIPFLVDQIGKSAGDLGSLGKVIARCLKNYIPDGTIVNGEECQCGGKLIRSQGCVQCPTCGYSKCS